jgi:coproporphyrinogen III oxidase
MKFSAFTQEWINFIHQLQDDICHKLEITDGQAKFQEDVWQRPEGGGGKTRIIANGQVFEKGGVNTSVVYGQVSDVMSAQLKINGHQWFACGMSIVLHPKSPMQPTIHCNYRMFELYDEQQNIIDRWFGGGTDLTPYYLDIEDAKHFHETHKKACDQFSVDFYPKMKQTCDDYFVNYHRNNERRGIGGIFYDHKRADEHMGKEQWLSLAKTCGYAFLEAYLPIIEKHKEEAYTDAQKYWQEIRRGRYVEFNLLHDRGTIFGLKTNGRTESILMSLPATVRFDYQYQPEAGSIEESLVKACLSPVDWLGLG